MSIITDNLLTNFDLTNPICYNSINPNYIISSIKYPYSSLSNLNLDDFGLNMYDNGRVNIMSSYTENFSYVDNKLKLYKVGYNDNSGNTTYETATFMSSNTINYFNLNGGYFQNFFKLEDYNYELLPDRYKKGLTIETWLYNDSNTYSNILSEKDGFFIYLGLRSENKFQFQYSGETGYTTTNGINLNPEFDDLDKEESIYDNCIGFRLNNLGNIGYRFISTSGTTIENYTTKSIPTGWTQIGITFNPCPNDFKDEINNIKLNDILQNTKDNRFKLTWDEIKDCLDRRYGELIIYINGKIFHKFENFPEQFWFHGFNTNKEKQIGVPYNISWGGGTFGLKNNWRFNITDTNYPYEHDYEEDNLLIENNFDGSFYGNISILRVYDSPLNSTEIKQNFNSVANMFGFNKIQGGRVIYV